MTYPQIFWYKLDKNNNKSFSKIHDVYSDDDLVTLCGIKIPVSSSTFVVRHSDDNFNIHPFYSSDSQSECFRCFGLS